MTEKAETRLLRRTPAVIGRMISHKTPKWSAGGDKDAATVYLPNCKDVAAWGHLVSVETEDMKRMVTKISSRNKDRLENRIVCNQTSETGNAGKDQKTLYLFRTTQEDPKRPRQESSFAPGNGQKASPARNWKHTRRMVVIANEN